MMILLKKGATKTNVQELTRAQLDELKQNYICTACNSPSWGDLADVDRIPDSIIFEYYTDTVFRDDDFFCSAEYNV